MSTDWEGAANAIAAWVKAGSGLPSGSVIWGGQGGARPDVPYISMRIMTVSRRGQDWLAVKDHPTDPGLVELVVSGPRRCTLSLQCFATSPIDTAGAAMILDAVLTAAQLPSVRAALNAANVGINGSDPVNSIGAVLNETTWEPRAIVNVRFNIPSELAESSSFIEFVELINSDDVSSWVPSQPLQATLSATLDSVSLVATATVA